MALSNSQYDAIMRVYNQRQFQDKREQDKRIAEVYEKIPQVEALSDDDDRLRPPTPHTEKSRLRFYPVTDRSEMLPLQALPA